jgi:hypothetical protein
MAGEGRARAHIATVATLVLAVDCLLSNDRRTRKPARPIRQGRDGNAHVRVRAHRED